MKRIALFNFLCMVCLAHLLSGPSAGRADDKKDKDVPSFTKDIAPILQQRCQECHHKGGIGPMPLVNYEEVRPWARAIKEQVVYRNMPPFYAAGPIGYYSRDPRLTDEQISKISRWVDSGAPKGKLTDMPAQITWSSDWKLGPPDLILKPRQPYTVNLGGQDDYQLFVVDYVFAEDTWIRGMEIKPGNKQVVHHASLYIIPNDMKAGDDGRVENADLFVRGGQLFANWVPGSDARKLDDGYATLIRKGTRFGIQVHYAPTNKVMTDQTIIGLYFANGVIRKQQYSLYGGTDRIEIPPGESNYQIIEKRRFKTDALIKAFTVHMHLRGKSFFIRLYYPDGKVETVFELPRYNFNWQRLYKLAKPILVAKGTVVEYVATWDNSARNPYNPDPQKFVRFGEKTSDEMMSGTVIYDIPGEELNIQVKNGLRVPEEQANSKTR